MKFSEQCKSQKKPAYMRGCADNQDQTHGAAIQLKEFPAASNTELSP
jgi:hypothetical protein